MSASYESADARSSHSARHRGHCFVRGQDALAGTLRVDGAVVAPEKAKPILERVAQAMAPMAHKEICTKYEPSGTDFTAKISVGGTYQPDQDETVKWIGPAEGYTVTP